MIKVDQEKCIGCRACESSCPTVFKVENSKSQVISEGDVECAKKAAGECPVQAIGVTDQSVSGPAENPQPTPE